MPQRGLKAELVLCLASPPLPAAPLPCLSALSVLHQGSPLFLSRQGIHPQDRGAAGRGAEHHGAPGLPKEGPDPVHDLGPQEGGSLPAP